MQHNQAKIRVSAERQASIPIFLNNGNAIRLEGDFYPGRRLSEEAVIHVINSAIGEDAQHPPDALVPQGTLQRYSYRGVTIEIDCASAPGEPYAQFTYGDLESLTQSMLQRLVQQGQWGALNGLLFAQGMLTGSLSIEGKFEDAAQNLMSPAPSQTGEVSVQNGFVS